MKKYMWSVWKKCKLSGYVGAYSQWEALKRAESQFGKEIFIVRSGVFEERDGHHVVLAEQANSGAGGESS